MHWLPTGRLQINFGDQRTGTHVLAASPFAGINSISPVTNRTALTLRSPDGAPFVIVMLEVGEGRIHRIWAIANPDKPPIN